MTDRFEFSDLLANFARSQSSDTTWATNVPETWLQGRTTYGGLSAAMCLRAVELELPDLPPLRSAQINFIGPVSGEVSIKVSVLRQGKSVACVSADMIGLGGLATHAVFTFGLSRPSKLDQDFTEPPSVPGIEESINFFAHEQRPAFAKHFDCKLAQGGHPVSGSEHHEHYLWVRHQDKNAQGMTALMGIGDMPPPAVLPMFKEFAPISSMNWTVNILSEDLSTDDGWWLLRSAAEHARNGYSSQDMQVWNSEGKLVISAMQTVALFY